MTQRNCYYRSKQETFIFVFKKGKTLNTVGLEIILLMTKYKVKNKHLFKLVFRKNITAKMLWADKLAYKQVRENDAEVYVDDVDTDNVDMRLQDFKYLLWYLHIYLVNLLH